MNKNEYLTPEVELIGITLEDSVLQKFSGGEGTASGSAMGTGSWGSVWDSQED